jgi:hypothetical protein
MRSFNKRAALRFVQHALAFFRHKDKTYQSHSFHAAALSNGNVYPLFGYQIRNARGQVHMRLECMLRRRRGMRGWIWFSKRTEVTFRFRMNSLKRGTLYLEIEDNDDRNEDHESEDEQEFEYEEGAWRCFAQNCLLKFVASKKKKENGRMAGPWTGLGRKRAQC